MTVVHLYGVLAAKFGSQLEFEVEAPAEAMYAMTQMLPGFKEIVAASSWVFINGPKAVAKPMQSGEESYLAAKAEMHLMPSVEGGGGQGLIPAVAGAALIAAGMWFTGGVGTALIMAGGSMVAGAAMTMLIKAPKTDYGSKDGSKNASFLYNGPVSTSTQGTAIPVVYGEIEVGAIEASFGLVAEDL